MEVGAAGRQLVSTEERNPVLRKVIALEFMSLDGVMQTVSGVDKVKGDTFPYEGWQMGYADEVSGALMKKQMNNMPFDLLLGRKTFEEWIPFWPNHADMWPGSATATKYVASNTMTSSDWQPTVFLSGDVAEKVRQLKQQEGPDLYVYGSANLFQTLFKHDLVDVLWLKIYPVTLGIGKRLFTDGTIPASFKLTESTVTPNGIIFVNYEWAGAVKTGRS